MYLNGKKQFYSPEGVGSQYIPIRLDEPHSPRDTPSINWYINTYWAMRQLVKSTHIGQCVNSIKTWEAASKGKSIGCTIQIRTCNGSPARATIAFPSPVQVCAEVAEKYARP
jgi:hypothetical protein